MLPLTDVAPHAPPMPALDLRTGPGAGHIIGDWAAAPAQLHPPALSLRLWATDRRCVGIWGCSLIPLPSPSAHVGLYTCELYPWEGCAPLVP